MADETLKQHFDAFKEVEAFALLRDGVHVANISFKHPKGWGGKLWCYVHVFGCPMVRGCAAGGAAGRLEALKAAVGNLSGVTVAGGSYAEVTASNGLLVDISSKVAGCLVNWRAALVAGGYVVIQALHGVGYDN